MAYLALARKWRPKVFAEVVGQKHVVQALSNALDSGRVHHAFLFTGTRGVGKTTLARIFAKSLNCEVSSGAEPCQECNTCVAIDEGRYVDLIEVDAASRTKVDDTRELLENVHYAPTSGKYKIFLIDEVHMLSGHSFNALLKTLEEPPEHVKFLFATTDPQKLPVTVLSRCLQFNLRAMQPDQIENQMVKILTDESLNFDQSALHALAKAADGSMRDGLSLLDQAIAQGDGSVLSADVESMLGTLKAEHSDALLQALVQQDADKIMQVITEMADHAVDFDTALDEVLLQLYHISLAQIAPNAVAAKDVDQAAIKQLASAVDAETVQLYYQIGILGKRDIALAPSLRVGFEMAMLRMMVFEPNDEPLSRASPPGASAASAISAPAEVQSRSVTQTVINQRAAPNPSQSSPATSAAPNQAASTAAPAPSSQPSKIAVTLAGNNEWGELIEQTALMGLSKELAMHCACEKLADDKVCLALPPKSKHLLKPERLNEIQGELRLIVNAEVLVELEVEESDKETPVECLQRLGFAQAEQTKEQINSDPGVQALMNEFGATVNEQSIKPSN